MENRSVKMFGETYYPDVFFNLAQKTIEAFEEQLETIIDQMYSVMKDYLTKLENLQKEKLAPEIAEISISYLYTSGELGEPKFRIDSYGEGGRIYSESICTTEISASWLCSYIDEFLQELSDITLKESIRRFIRPAGLEVLKLRAIRSMLYYFASRFRYYITDIVDLRQLAKVKKADSFVIQMGEYMDWQKTLYAILPEVDIFNCDSDTVLSYRSYSAFYYHDKQFRELVINNARFMDCTFSHVVIEDCVMNDCLFSNCTFENVTFKNTKMIGSLLLDCVINNTVFDEVIMSTEGENEEQTEYYEPAKFSYCDFTDCQFKNCNLIECNIEECDFVTVTVEGGRLDYSDFLDQDDIICLDRQGE